MVDLDALMEALAAFFEDSPGRRRGRRLATPSNRIVFAAMPFPRRYDDTFFVAMSHTADVYLCALAQTSLFSTALGNRPQPHAIHA